MSRVTIAIGVAVVLAAAGSALAIAGDPPAPASTTVTGPAIDPETTEPIAPPTRWPADRWRRSLAVGLPNRGRLVRGVRLPREGPDFLTWDPVLEATPNRPWRRWGTDRLVRLLLRIARRHRAAHPDAPRLAIGDLSRPRGGRFDERFGGLGHASHQNGLDADVYYPRRDRRELAPARARQIDRVLARDLVDRFVAAGATYVFVGPRTGLRGPRRRVQPLIHHDDHMHVRIPPVRRGRGQLPHPPPGPPPRGPAAPAE